MTQKPRKGTKGDFGELKSQKFPGGACPKTSLEVGNRSVFILDPHLIFKAKTEKELIQTEHLLEKVYIDDVISVWDTSRNEIEEFLLQANNFHPTIKFTHG